MKKIYLLFAALGMIACPMFANAEEVYYTNDNGIEMTKEQYDYLAETFHPDVIRVMKENQFRLETEYGYYNTKEDVQYLRTDYKKDINGNIIGSYTSEITEKEYNEETPAMMITPFAVGNTDRYETEYKVLTLKVSMSSVQLANTRVVINNHWKKIPSVKQYDIIGYRLKTDKVNPGISPMTAEYSAHQIWDGNVWSYSLYDSNMIHVGTDIAEVMNIADDVKNTLDMDLAVYVNTGSTNVQVWASYQHCTWNDITKSEAMSATFSGTASSGYKILGGVFKYKDSVAQKYDQTKGVFVDFDFMQS